MKKVQVGLLGFGNVGSGVYRLLMDMRDELQSHEGISFQVKKILVRDVGRKREIDVPQGVLTDDPDALLLDPEISLVVECMGGEQPATDHMLRAMEQGKSVVTANKMALATFWYQLNTIAKQHGVGLYYEASAAAALPIVSSLLGSLQANRIDALMGIINGTTNYILSEMSNRGSSYADALRQAQDLGYAEPDPTADVEGFDAAYKLSILSSLAFHAHVPVNVIYREGISAISDTDIAYGKEMGYVLKLLAVAKRNQEKIEVRVHPTFIPLDHPLATVSGSFNAVFLHGHAAGDMMFYGRGAGDYPTASAIVSDMIRAARTVEHAHPTFEIAEQVCPGIVIESNWSSTFFVRLWAEDRPGVLSEVAGCFASAGVSIASMIQRAARPDDGRVALVFVTHLAREQAMHQALSALDPDMASVAALIRVEA